MVDKAICFVKVPRTDAITMFGLMMQTTFSFSPARPETYRPRHRNFREGWWNAASDGGGRIVDGSGVDMVDNDRRR